MSKYNWTPKRIKDHIKTLKRLIAEVKHSGMDASHLERELENFKKARGI